MTIFPERLKALHSRTPERVAVYLQFPSRDDLPLTYARLLRGASAYARTLEREGIQPGEVVVLELRAKRETQLFFDQADFVLHEGVEGMGNEIIFALNG